MAFDFATYNTNGVLQLIGASSYMTVYSRGVYTATATFGVYGNAYVYVGGVDLLNGEYLPIMRKVDSANPIANNFHMGAFMAYNGNATVFMGEAGSWEIVLLKKMASNNVSTNNKHGLIIYDEAGGVKYTSDAPSFVITSVPTIYVGAYDANRSGSVTASTGPYANEKLFYISKQTMVTLSGSNILNIPIQNVSGGTVTRQYKMTFSVSGYTINYTLTFNQQYTQQSTTPPVAGVNLAFYFGLVK